MRGSSRGQAAWGHLARLVAALVVITGFALLHSPHCAEGMSAPACVSGNATTAMAMTKPAAELPVIVTADADHDRASAAPANAPYQTTAVRSVARIADIAAKPSSPSGGQDGILAACLAFVVAVVVSLVILRPALGYPLRGAVAFVRVPRIHAVWPRAPSLAELCVLRT